MGNWKYNIEGWGSLLARNASLDVRLDQIVELLRASEWYAAQEDGEDSELGKRISDLERCADIAAANAVIGEIYDLADDQRAWLDSDS